MGWYLVTGAAGFIGARVAARLLEAGHDVVGLDNLNDAYDARVKHWRLARLEADPRFAFHRADVADRAAIEALFGARADRCEAVVNLAARAGVRQSVENPWVYVETNVTGTLNLLEACRERRIGKFVLASTSSLYGADSPRPFREDGATDRPLSPYAASKKGAEAMCHSYHALSGLDVTVLRYFTVYGPAGRPDMALFRFVQAISEGRPITVYGDGTQSRDFTYVDDIAEGTVAALKPVGYEVINLGSDEPIVLRDAIRLVERLVGREAVVEHADRHPADVPATWADISKAERVLGWRPRTRFEEGVERLVEWYGANREWAKDIATG